MIKADGTRVVIGGSPTDIMQDFANIVESVRSVFTEKFGRTNADDLISTLGMFAYTSDEDEKKMFAERCFEIVVGKENKINS